MFISKINKTDRYFVLFFNQGAESVPLTYGALRSLCNQEVIDKLETQFDKYLLSGKGDNTFVAFTIPDDDVEFVNEELSKY
ncbi:hypothetical protein [Leuconostoc gasicomitatum]|uniref:hypothetical protein n=1 Tax=Leuconostoc gasicomitatum TaxID=115778 RepID=UPI000744B640|nr:hypothetical protein [Leuconostoc gasicomitatum]CUR63899.1 Uncharacterized protein LEKG_1312 [Leuconostoc gasicomitatum KG16-1]